METIPRECRRARTPAGGPGHVPRLEPSPRVDVGRVLVCASCATPITADSLAISVEGSSIHRRINPLGFEFEFRCFRAAPGAADAGAPTEEHTWFPGYAWSYALCRGCLTHLGWFFRRHEDSFFGLVLDRLREEGEGPARSDP